MNKIILIGRLTRDLEPKNAKSGMLYVNFTLAVNRKVKKGEEKKADFFNCTAFNYTAENMIKFLHKGSQVAVEGRGTRTATIVKSLACRSILLSF